MDVNEILDERQKTHGEFATQAAIAQALKRLLVRYGQNKLSDVQAEALGMICHKISRILNGNPDYKDHWADISGYATLVLKEIEQEKKI